ncbi:Reticulocyte-binding protein 2-like protein a [Frankliniella fusca]|uniref:Reticulocyte-binding protein 2-like protein a n=1 Tax=Frankliniella fusca TaxID=407009 RepID=A0AAE1HHX6_9NEOP|nr:Reticulocyte-binding protein 2-like protein a [Frankliniella fusca]
MSKELFALVKYASPYEAFGKDVVTARDIGHLVGPKLGGTRKMCEFKPKNVTDFIKGQLYRLKSDKDSVDGESHPYYVYIGAMSESKQELERQNNDPTSKRITWVTADDPLSEAESSSAENMPAVGISAVLEEKNNSKNKRLAHQANVNNAMLKLQSKGHFDLRAPLVEMQPNNALEELKRLQAELREREEATQRREEVLRQKEEEARRKEDLLRKKAEDLNKQDDRIDSLLNTMEKLKSDVEKIYSKLDSMCKYNDRDTSYVMEWLYLIIRFKWHSNLPVLAVTQPFKAYIDELLVLSQFSFEYFNTWHTLLLLAPHHVLAQSGSSLISGGNNSTPSTVSSSIVTIFGLQIKEEFYKAIEGGSAVVDFCNNILKGCFGDDAPFMRKNKGKPETKVFSQSWFDGARAYYRDWLLRIKRRDGSSMSPAEVEGLVQELGSELGKAARNMVPKGVNRVRAEAVAKNVDARQAVKTYQHERAAGAAGAAGAAENEAVGTSPKPRKKRQVRGSLRDSLPPPAGPNRPEQAGQAAWLPTTQPLPQVQQLPPVQQLEPLNFDEGLPGPIGPQAVAVPNPSIFK